MHSGLLISLSLVGVTWFFLSVEFDMIKQHITYTPCGCLVFRCAGVLICPDKLCSFPGKVCKRNITVRLRLHQEGLQIIEQHVAMEMWHCSVKKL